MSGVPVVAVATHDTGSAVAGAPIEDGWAYISSGTWSLVGTELSRSLVNERVAALNFTNEGGAYGTTRFLRNVMGLWILESCRAEWATSGLDVTYAHLLEDVAAIEGPRAVVFPDDPRFLHPPSMIDALGRPAARDRATAAPRPPRRWPASSWTRSRCATPRSSAAFPR